MSNSKITLFICLLLSFAVGASINSLGSSNLAFQRAFGASNEVLGRIQMLFFIGGGAIVVAGGWLTERLGEKKAAGLALTCLTLGSLAVASATSLRQVFVSALLVGLGSIWASVSYSVIVAKRYADRRQSMFSIITLSETTSAILQPLAFSAWFAHVESSAGASWVAVFYGLAMLMLVELLVLSLAWKPAPEARGERLEIDAKESTPARQVIFSGALWLIGVCVLLHGLFQIGFVFWIGPYYAARLGITPAQAAVFVSVSSAGFFPGRALLGWLSARFKIPNLVLLGIASGTGTVMICLAVLSGSYLLALVFTFLEGLFVAGDAPAMLSFVGERFVSRPALAYALYAGFGQVGAAGGGYVVGALGDWIGHIQQAFWVVPIVSGSLCLLAFAWHTLERRGARAVS
jgi:MFS family permease